MSDIKCIKSVMGRLIPIINIQNVLPFLFTPIILTLLFSTNIIAQHWNGEDGTEKDIFREGNVGIGFSSEPALSEKLEVDGGVKIGFTSNTNAGTLRWVAFGNGDFQGWNGTEWKSLVGFWNISGADIHPINSGSVRIGQVLTSNPTAKLLVGGDISSDGNIFMNETGLRFSGLIPQGGTSHSTIDQTQLGLTIKSQDGYSFFEYTGTQIRFRINENGNIGIGKNPGNYKLDINGDINADGIINAAANIKVPWTSKIILGSNNSAYIQGYDDGGPEFEGIKFFTTLGGVNNPALIIDGNGRVGIGKTPNTNYTFDVNGKIRANEIVVNTTGADFVFEDDYDLRALSEVESFIKENKHLPDIPTAKEVEENGVSLGEMQSKLLQKIEELTLYMIELKKENDVLKAKVYDLDNR